MLFFEGCPNHGPTVDLVRDVVAACGLEARLDEVEVSNREDAERLRFPGSPTVRVDGIDIEPVDRTTAEYALGCRLYGSSGVPPRELLVAAVDRRRS